MNKIALDKYSELTNVTNSFRSFNHLTAVGSDTGRDGKTRQFSNRGPGKTVHRIGTNLENKPVRKTLKRLALGGPTLRASCRPSKTAFLKGSVSFFKSAFARFRAEIRSSKIVGSNPFLLLLVTKRSMKNLSEKMIPPVTFKTRRC